MNILSLIGLWAEQGCLRISLFQMLVMLEWGNITFWSLRLRLSSKEGVSGGTSYADVCRVKEHTGVLSVNRQPQRKGGLTSRQHGAWLVKGSWREAQYYPPSAYLYNRRYSRAILL